MSPSFQGALERRANLCSRAMQEDPLISLANPQNVTDLGRVHSFDIP